MRSYSELSAKSCFSFLQAASHPEELVEQASRLGYQSLGLCDYHGFYGMVRAYQKANELSLALSVGTEISVENSSLCLIAKNLRGYQKICRLLSEGFCGQEKHQPIFKRENLEAWLDEKNMFIFLPPRNFPSESLFLWLRERFLIHQFVSKSHSPNADHQMKLWLKKIPQDIPRVWTWDAFFHKASRLELFNILKAIRENKKLSAIEPAANAEKYLKPLHYLDKLHVPLEWSQKTCEVAEQCEFSPSQIRYQYPQEWLPPGKKSFEFLEELCQQGLQRRFPGGHDASISQQLQHELQLVKELQYEDYFLSVWDIVQFARSQNILCQGRGSAANSVICYLLEITSINPVQMNLLFERFLSKERNEAPDIDVDFEHERREEVIQYVYKKYGRHRAGMVATLITYRTKSALRDIGKALDLPLKQIESLSKKSKWRENVFENEGSENITTKRLLRLVRELRGFPRHLGQHTGGMILCQNRLDEMSPIEPARMPDRSIVQWDKYDIEKLGLLKIDLLSLGMLTCIRKSFDLLKENKIADLELHRLPQDDPKTFQMISESKTVGVFQIESRAQMSMLPKLRPKTFYDLVIEVAIVRPGPIQGGMVHPYLRRRMGLEKVEYAHPKLEPILKKTLGIPIFQEQVMKMAIDVAGYSPGEADALRRAMGAWKKTGNLESFARDICERLSKRGVPQDFAERICQQILGFGEYGFPESHAASFALLTYASAYLKAHHPPAFLCSILNSMPMGFYPMHVLSSTFMREGVSVLRVSLEKSQWDHRLEERDGVWCVRLGFRCVKNLQKEHALKFIETRGQNPHAFEVFTRDEKTSLAMIRENEKRLHYWKALNSQKNSLPLGSEKKLEFKNPDPLQSLFFDFEFMQASLQEHPVSLIKKSYWSYSTPIHQLKSSRDLEECQNHKIVMSFGMIQIVQSPPTAKGMFFITAEDESGFLNYVFSPPIWAKYKHIVQSEGFLLIRGKLQKASKYHSILVQQVMEASLSPNSQIPPARVGY